METRWRELGELLVQYCARVQPGERVMIAMGEAESLPLVQAVYTAVIHAGGFPQVQFLSEHLRHALLEMGNERQLSWVPEIEAQGMQWADVYFGLRGAYDLDIHQDIHPGRLAANQKAQGVISSLRWQHTRWCLVRVPNQSFARQVGLEEREILDMFFAACLLDWEAASREWQRWADILNQGKHVHILAPGTDLKFSIEGRTWQVGDGRCNMPDGEINTAPLEDSVEGQISFNYPGVLSGRLVEGICLRWEKGRLVEATASTHQDFLQSILNSDTGASWIGEFGLGTNPHLRHFCKDILIDEKIYGTLHLALGRAYPASGGTNQSAIHWDIIQDTRPHGVVYVDERVILRDGEFLL